MAEAETEQKAEPTREQIAETAPLYSKYDIKNFFPPDKISRVCDKCGKETTWGVTCRDGLNSGAFVGYACEYQCILCDKSNVLMFFRQVDRVGAPSFDWLSVQKIGQYPPPTIDIPRDLYKQLGDTAVFYRNALVCRNQGYGIAALAYLRRVVEDKTHELIDVVAEEAAAYGADPEHVAAVRAAKEQRVTFDEKLRIASEAIPETLKPDGANPVGAIFNLLSQGLHAKSDDECIGIADDLKDVFEYVFTKLRAEIQERARVMAKVKQFAARK